MIAHTSQHRTGEWAHGWLREVGDRSQRGRAHPVSAPARRPRWLGQSLKFATVGLFNTALDAALYLVLTGWLGFAGLKILAKAISYAAGIANSFYWNRSWTFGSTEGSIATFVSFALASLLALAINAAAMALGLMVFDQYQLPALALATGTTLLWNFCTSKFLVFKR